MRIEVGVKCAAVALLSLLFAGRGWGQDTRTVTEPVFPAVCTVLQAQQAIVGGEPASETTFDTTRLQAALTACGSGKAVELTTDGGSNNAFLIGPINLPNGVTLLVDGGVTVFASRNPADYQISGAETCGTVGTAGNGCNPLFKVNNNSTSTGSGIMGYGVIDGRGGDLMLVNGTPSTNTWWDIARQAQNVSNGDQNNFVMLAASKANNFTLYKITFKNSPMFHVTWKNATGLTAWGVKIITPYTARNSDGIDPQGSNITITNSSISDGDDNVAVSASSASSNITISHNNTYSGHGISVGSYTQGGLQNMLVMDINQAGTAQDGNGIALRLKSAQDRGGVLNNVTYQNICMQNHRTLISLNPFYNSNSGTSIPKFTNVTFHNVHALTEGVVQLQGHDASNPLTMTLNNVVFDVLKQSDLSPAPSYATITLGPGPVSPALLQTQTGTGVTYNGSVTDTTVAPYACSAANFTFLVGELYLSTATSTNQNQLSATAPASFTLNAMLQPAMSQVTFSTWTGVATPTEAVQFMEGSTVVGTGTLSGNGTIATVALTGVTAGTHTYTAVYPGDTNYAAYNFGGVTVTVAPATLVATATGLTGLPTSGTYGSSTTLTAAVTGAGGTPTGQVTFKDGAAVLGSANVNSAGVATVSQTLAGGSHSITALYAGDSTFAASTSPVATVAVSPAASTTAVSSAPTTFALSGSTVLTAMVTGVSGGAVPTGLVTFYDGTTVVGSGGLDGTGKATAMVTPSALGSHSVTAVYTGDGNYATSQAAAVTVTVTAAVTTTALSASSTSVSAGSNVTLTATVASAAGTPAGTVTFLNGGTSLGTATLVSGTAALSVPVGSVGTDTMTASYAANGNFAASTSSAVTITVTAAATTTALSASATSANAGSNVTLTAAVSSGGGTPTGTVTFVNGATTLGTATLTNGTVTLSAPVGSVGTDTITASYAANGNFAASTSSAVTITVSAVATTTTLSLSTGTIFIGGTATLTATVASSGGTPAGTVTFLNGVATLGTATLTNGIATLAAPTATAGTLNVTAVYGANGNFAASTSSGATLTVVPPIGTATASPTTLSLAAGASGTATVTVMPAAGFTGAVTFSCLSPVAYLSCTMAPATVTAGVVQATATISVAATVSESRPGLMRERGLALYAAMLPVGLFGLVGAVRRRRLVGVALLVMLLMVAGCGGSGSSAAAPKLPPAGAQVVTITASTTTAAGILNQTTQVTVNVTN